MPQINDMVLRHAIKNDFDLPGDEILQNWLETYLGDTPTAMTEEHFTDKNPLNFEALGLINHVFADSPIIHIRRCPVETCLSIYKQKFSKFWRFAHSLDDIAHFYSIYVRLMAYWENCLPDRVFNIKYEELVGEMPGQTALLLEYCGLPWEQGCVDFPSSKQAIATLSSVQVREKTDKPSRPGLGYGELLDPLRLALRKYGVNPESGELL